MTLREAEASASSQVAPCMSLELWPGCHLVTFETLLIAFALVAPVEACSGALSFPTKVCPSPRQLMRKIASKLLPGRMSWEQHLVALVPSY